MHLGSHDFSIIVPTFREAKNIPELIRRIAETPKRSCRYEVILMDDNSQDGTEEIVRALQKSYSWLRLIVRQEKKGLSESVLEGFTHAQYPMWVIMDADLSHPPEKIPEMLDILANPNVDMVIGSRYISGGSSDELWPTARKAVSRIAAWMARTLIAVPVNDPLSGFLALKKETYQRATNKIQPIGWKIGLELMVKCGCKNIQEVPIHFAQRTQGISKLNMKVIANYMQHVYRLMWFKMFSVSKEQ